jgi:hypothetical protein
MINRWMIAAAFVVGLAAPRDCAAEGSNGALLPLRGRRRSDDPADERYKTAEP